MAWKFLLISAKERLAASKPRSVPHLKFLSYSLGLLLSFLPHSISLFGHSLGFWHSDLLLQTRA
jgi:hypothetical protein